MSEPCKFGNKCNLTAGEHGTCPRHHALIEALGKTMALRIEYGVLCESCEKNYDHTQVTSCGVCETADVCDSCRAAWMCCGQTADNLSAEIRAQQREIDTLESRLDELQSRLGAIEDCAKELDHRLKEVDRSLTPLEAYARMQYRCNRCNGCGGSYMGNEGHTCPQQGGGATRWQQPRVSTR